MEKVQKEKNNRSKIRDGLFITAYLLWMLRAFLRTTFFYEHPFCVALEQCALPIAVSLSIWVFSMDFCFRIRELLLVFGVTLCALISYWTGGKQVAVTIFLMMAARNVPFRKIIKWTYFVMVPALLFVVICSLTGVIDNYVFYQDGGRVRYGLGFLYCSYTSHYLLLFAMVYLVLQERIRWYGATLLVALNLVGFLVTDTKTDLLSLGLMFFLVPVFRWIGSKEKLAKLAAVCGFVMPFVFLVISFWSAKAYDSENGIWQKLNLVLNHRLQLGNQAIKDYDVKLFGQKIQWVGGSAKLKDPTLIYNYVDNNYLSVTLQFGVMVAGLMCLLYARAIYITVKKGQAALAAGLIVFTIVGLVNPEMRNLLYNTFLLLLLKPATLLGAGESSLKQTLERRRE